MQVVYLSLLVFALPLLSSACSTIYSQDGLGFSGQICPKRITDPVKMTMNNRWPAGLTRGTSAFLGGVFDGNSVWLVPRTSDAVVRVSTSTGAMTLFNAWPAGLTRGSNSFAGGVFDGSSIWMAPFNADAVVKVDTSSGAMTMYNDWPSGLNRGSQSFAGGVFDGNSVWLVPRTSDAVVKLESITHSETTSQSFVTSGSASATVGQSESRTTSASGSATRHPTNSGSLSSSSSASSSATQSGTENGSSSASGTATATLSQSESRTVSVTGSATTHPTHSDTLTSTSTGSPSRTESSSGGGSSSASGTGTVTLSHAESRTDSDSRSATTHPTHSDTLTSTSTDSSSTTRSSSERGSSSASGTATATPSHSVSSSASATASTGSATTHPTLSGSLSPTFTGSSSATQSKTDSGSSPATATLTQSESHSASATRSGTTHPTLSISPSSTSTDSSSTTESSSGSGSSTGSSTVTATRTYTSSGTIELTESDTKSSGTSQTWSKRKSTSRSESPSFSISRNATFGLSDSRSSTIAQTASGSGFSTVTQSVAKSISTTQVRSKTRSPTESENPTATVILSISPSASLSQSSSSSVVPSRSRSGTITSSLTSSITTTWWITATGSLYRSLSTSQSPSSWSTETKSLAITKTVSVSASPSLSGSSSRTLSPRHSATGSISRDVTLSVTPTRSGASATSLVTVTAEVGCRRVGLEFNVPEQKRSTLIGGCTDAYPTTGACPVGADTRALTVFVEGMVIRAVLQRTNTGREYTCLVAGSGDAVVAMCPGGGEGRTATLVALSAGDFVAVGVVEYGEAACPAVGCSGHGACVQGRCACWDGWGGDVCDRCGSGWFGASCSMACPQLLESGLACGGYGECGDGADGTGECVCEGHRDPGSGCASCVRGWGGPMCETVCDCGVGGAACSVEHDGSARCRCRVGFALDGGGLCAACAAGHYGLLCASCRCATGGVCDEGMNGTGLCRCAVGFVGENCGTRCPVWRNRTCGEGTCVAADVACVCSAGWSVGADGACSVCAAGWSGADCSCRCNRGRCGVDGVCVCDAGFAGPTCSTPCVVDAEGRCVVSCLDGRGVVVDGECECRHGYAGSLCDLLCPRSWDGTVCDGRGVCETASDSVAVCRCSAGFYGTACTIACDALTCARLGLLQSVCDADGVCRCAPGWAGASCGVCAADVWGPSCDRECGCSGHGTCAAATGACSCYSDRTRGYWDGPSCGDCAANAAGESCTTLVTVSSAGSTGLAVSDGARLVVDALFGTLWVLGSVVSVLCGTTRSACGMFAVGAVDVQFDTAMTALLLLSDGSVVVVRRAPPGMTNRTQAERQWTATGTTAGARLLGDCVFTVAARSVILGCGASERTTAATPGSVLWVSRSWSGAVYAGTGRELVLVRAAERSIVVSTVADACGRHGTACVAALACDVALSVCVMGGAGAVILARMDGTDVRSTMHLQYGDAGSAYMDSDEANGIAVVGINRRVYAVDVRQMRVLETWSLLGPVESVAVDAALRLVTVAVGGTAWASLYLVNLFGVTSSSHDVVDAAGGAVVELTGFGLVSDGSLGRVWCDMNGQSMAATVMNATRLSCAVPALVSGPSGMCGDVTVWVMIGTRPSSSSVTWKPATSARVAAAVADGIGAAGVGEHERRTQVRLLGSGFVPSGQARCRLSDARGGVVVDVGASWVSGGEVACEQQALPAMNGTWWSYSHDGYVYGSTRAPWAIAGRVAALDVSSSTNVVVSAARSAVPAVRVRVEDRFGTLVATVGGFVVCTVGPSVVEGTVVNGTAAVSGLYLSAPLVGRMAVQCRMPFYGLTVGLTIDVVAGVAVGLRLRTSSATWFVGVRSSTPLEPPPEVVAVDMAGNVVWVADGTVVTLSYTRHVAGSEERVAVVDGGAFIGGRAVFRPVVRTVFGGGVALTFVSLGLEPLTVPVDRTEVCAPGSEYSVFGTTECRACPLLGECDGSVMVGIRDGVWRGSQASLKMYPCTPSEACGGGGCRVGYEGPLCGTCADGYGRGDAACVRCSPTWVSMIMLVLSGCVSLFMVFKAAIWPLRKAIGGLVEESTGVVQQLVTVGVFHAQILSVMPVPSGTSTSVVTKAFGAVSGRWPVAIASCLVKTPTDKLVAAVLTPLVLVPFVVLLTHVVVRNPTVATNEYIRTHFRMHRVKGIEHWRRAYFFRFAPPLVYLLALLSPVVISSATDLIVCRDIDFGGGRSTQRHLVAQLTTWCDGGTEYSRGALVAWITLLLVALGTPLIVLAVLWTSRRRAGASATGALFRAQVLQYREDRWYWDAAVRFWLTCFVLVQSLVGDSKYRALVGFWLLCAYGIGCFVVSPFRTSVSQRSYSASVWSLALLYFLTYADIVDAARTMIVIAATVAVAVSISAPGIGQLCSIVCRRSVKSEHLRSELAQYRTDQCSRLLCSRRARKEYREFCTMLILVQGRTSDDSPAAVLGALFAYEQKLCNISGRELTRRAESEVVRAALAAAASAASPQSPIVVTPRMPSALHEARTCWSHGSESHDDDEDRPARPVDALLHEEEEVPCE